MELNKIMSGVLLMGVVVTAIILYFSGGVNEYSSTVVGYDSGDLQAFNNSISQMQNVTNKTANDLQKLKGNPDAADILSAFFTSAYGSVQTAAASTTTFFTIINTGVSHLGLGSFGNTLIGVLGAVVIIAIFVGIILHVVTKSDRT